MFLVRLNLFIWKFWIFISQNTKNTISVQILIDLPFRKIFLTHSWIWWSKQLNNHQSWSGYVKTDFSFWFGRDCVFSTLNITEGGTTGGTTWWCWYPHLPTPWLPPFDLEFDLINRIKFKTFKKLMFTWLLSLLLTSNHLLLRFSEVRVITHYLLTLGFKISPVTRYLPITLKASQCLHSLLLNLLA